MTEAVGMPTISIGSQENYDWLRNIINRITGKTFGQEDAEMLDTEDIENPQPRKPTVVARRPEVTRNIGWS